MLCLYVKVIMLTVLFFAFYLENGSGRALRESDLGFLGRYVGNIWERLTQPELDDGEPEASR